MKSTSDESNLKGCTRNRANSLLESTLLEMKDMIKSAAEGNKEKWELFKKQLLYRFGTDEDDLEVIIKSWKDGVPITHFEIEPLMKAYIKCKASICDDCDHNPNQRKGARKYKPKKRFNCDYELRKSDIFEQCTFKLDEDDEKNKAFHKLLEEYSSKKINAEELLDKAKELAGNLRCAGWYSLSDNKIWKRAYDKLNRIVLEDHTDESKPPKWLNLEENICRHHEFEVYGDNEASKLRDWLHMVLSASHDVYNMRVYKDKIKQLSEKHIAIVCDHLEKAKQDPSHLEKARAEIEKYSEETEKISTSINKLMLEMVSDSFLPFNIKQYEDVNKTDAMIDILNKFVFIKDDRPMQIYYFYKAINDAGIRYKRWPAEAEEKYLRKAKESKAD